MRRGTRAAIGGRAMGRKSIWPRAGTGTTIPAMIRRAVFASFLVLAISAGGVLAAAKTVTISGSAFTPPSTTVAIGGSVQWKNTTSKKQTVVSDAPFLWGTLTIKAHKTKTLVFQQAGSFAYHDSLKAGLKGTIQVPMTADAVVVSVGNYVTLTLGNVAPSGPVWHDVVQRFNGGAWSQIATSEGTTTDVLLSTAGTYEFETRLHQALSGWTTGWSPIVTVTAQ